MRWRLVANLDTWFSVAVAFVTVAIAWLTYRNQSNRKQLEYLVVSVQQLVSPRVATDLVAIPFNWTTTACSGRRLGWGRRW